MNGNILRILLKKEVTQIRRSFLMRYVIFAMPMLVMLVIPLVATLDVKNVVKEDRVPVDRPVGMGSYALDCHYVSRVVDNDGLLRNEGTIFWPTVPYQIDYGAIVPKREECTNLLVPVCLSASHVAYSSIRMEPNYMVLGQSAATAAALALDEGCPVQDVDYNLLSRRLLEDGQILEY